MFLSMSRNLPSLKWSSLTEEESIGQKKGPKTRHKHSICLHRGVIYLFGGKDSNNVTYKELWQYDIALTTWEKIKDSGDKPPCLQGHTMLGYKDNLYVFGGNFCFAGSEETPLWIYNLQTSVWRKYKNDAEAVSPSSRRNHTMVHYAGCLYVYGGYIDLKGSTSHLWMFDIGKKQWHLLYGTPQQQQSLEGPGTRHSHSSVVYDKAMWVFGGMSDLQVKNDMWRWHFGVKQWQKLKLRQSAPELVDHTAVHVEGHMLVYGGMKEGAPHSDVWSFHFDSLTWQKLQHSSLCPPPRSQHGVILINPLQLGFSTAVSSENNRTSSAPYVKAEYSNQSSNLTRPRSSPAYTKDDKVNTNRRMMVNSNKVLPKDLPSFADAILEGKSHYKKELEANGIPMHEIGNNGQHMNGVNGAVKETALITYADCSQFKNSNRSSSSSSSLVKNDKDVGNTTRLKSTGYSKFVQTQRLRQRQHSMRRQSSSCDSVNQGFTPGDSRSLLQKQRSRTLGNVSLDSQSGMDNFGYLNSSGNSDYLRFSSVLSGDSTWSDLSNNSKGDAFNISEERDDLDLKTDGPVKKLRKFHSQCNDDPGFIGNKYYKEGPANRMIQKRNRQAVWKKCASVESILLENSRIHLKKEEGSPMIRNMSEDKLLTAANGDYNVNLSGSDAPRRKSVVSDDLYLVDIEDWELDEIANSKESDTLVHNSPIMRAHSSKGINMQSSFEDQSGYSLDQSTYSYDDLSVNSRTVLLGNDICNYSDYKYSGKIGDENNSKVNATTIYENASFDAVSSAIASSHSSLVSKIKPAWQKIDEDIEMTELGSDGKRQDEVLTRCDYFTYEQLQPNRETQGQDNPSEIMSKSRINQGLGLISNKKDSRNSDVSMMSMEANDTDMLVCDKKSNNKDSQFILKKSESQVRSNNIDWGHADMDIALSKNLSQPTHFVMMVLGGKEARSKNFSVQPISMWKLEIKF